MRVSGYTLPNTTTPPDRDNLKEPACLPVNVNTRQAPQCGDTFSWSPSNAAQTQRQQMPDGFCVQRRNVDPPTQPSSLDFLRAIFVPPSQEVTGTSADSPTVRPLPQASQANASGESMSFEELVTVLGRHENLLKDPQDRQGLKKLRDDPATPSDAKRALNALLTNADYYDAFDQGKEGKKDGRISSKDVQALQQHPQIRAYADFKAGQYTDNYVPSDAPPGSPPRQMTQNDAMRELYLYSESLPGDISLDTLRKIADGSEKMGKCPPQVAAAAKFFTQNPEKWQAFSGQDNPSGTISKDRLCDLVANQIKLSPQEDKALKTLQNNKDIFFKDGGLKPEKLEAITNNKNNSQEVRDTANLLSQPNSMLFSMLDNAKHGAGGNFFNKANDRNITGGDLDLFIKNGSHQVAEPARASSRPVASAQWDMAAGQETQPDEKKEKGGGFAKFLDIFTTVASGLLMLIPGAGAAGAAAMAARTAATIGRTVASAAAREGVTQAGKHVTKETLVQGIKDGAKEGLREGAKNGFKEGARDFTKEAGKDLLHDGIDYLTQSNAPPVSSNPHVEAPRVWAQS